MLYLKQLLTAVMITAVICSCSKKKEDTPTPGEVNNNNGYPNETPKTPKGLVKIHLHTVIEGVPAETYADEPVNEVGRAIALKYIQVYLSDFELIASDGSTYPLKKAIVLYTLDNATYPLDSAPVGTYTSLKFKIGLRPSLDQSDSIAILKQNAMLFGTTAKSGGHIFFNFQGKIDTSATSNGLSTSIVPFVYKIGTPANLTEKTMPLTLITVTKDLGLIHLQMEMSRLFKGLENYLRDPKNLQVTNASENASEIAKKIVSNIPSTFEYEHVH